MKKPVTKTIAQVAAMGALFASGGAASAAEGEWEFALSPLFLWGVSMDGDATINGKTAPLELNFKDDIFENLETVFTLHFEARRGDWTFFTEFQYLDLTPEVVAEAGPISIKADIDFEATMFELGTGWTFSQSESTRWEVIGGARYTDQEITTDIDITAPPPTAQTQQKLEAGDDWWHAFGGVRVTHAFTDRWNFTARGDLGYGGSDNSAANLGFMFRYRFRDWGSAFIGARYLRYDYDNDSSSNGYAYDAAQTGPMAGITIHW